MRHSTILKKVSNEYTRRANDMLVRKTAYHAAKAAMQAAVSGKQWIMYSIPFDVVEQVSAILAKDGIQMEPLQYEQGLSNPDSYRLFGWGKAKV